MTVPVPPHNSKTLMSRLARMRSAALAFMLAFGAFAAALPVRADDTADISRLYKAGRLDEALARADEAIKANPRDPRPRFLKGVVLMEQHHNAQAQTVFEQLTQDYPELPEPYNNLAVLYAAQGDYQRARSALETVVRINPDYAVAYENLGDVHLQLASQAYANAQRLDPGNGALGTRLAAIKDLLARRRAASQP